MSHHKPRSPYIGRYIGLNARGTAVYPENKRRGIITGQSHDERYWLVVFEGRSETSRESVNKRFVDILPKR